MGGEQRLEQIDGFLVTVEEQQSDGLVELRRAVAEDMADGGERE